MASAGGNEDHVKPTSVAVLERLMALSAVFAGSKSLFLIAILQIEHLIGHRLSHRDKPIWFG